MDMEMYIVARRDKLVYHFGLLVSGEKILHYASKSNNMFKNDQVIRYDNLIDFAMDRKVSLVCNDIKVDQTILLERAKRYWGKNKKYSLRNNNCILFILWCIGIEEKVNTITVIKYYLIFIRNKMKLKKQII